MGFGSGLMVGFVCGGLFVLAAFVYYATKDTPRACVYQGCTTNHWNLGNYCSHHELDQDDERYG
jgi:hypothetical protein